MEKALTILAASLVLPLLALAEPVELDLLAPPPEWKQVLDQLATEDPVKTGFEELRTNPFHKRPRRFNGDIFWHSEFGLSLQYEDPAEIKINMSQNGVTLYRPEEDPKQMEIPEDNPGMSLFFKLFDWDISWLIENFSIIGEMDDSAWKLQLRPLDQQSSKTLSRIDLKGEADILQSILLDFPGGRKISIRLFDQERPWQAECDVIRKQFEIPDAKE